MTEETQKSAENSISDALNALLPQLTTNQLRWIVARQECTTDGEAAEMIGVKPDTMYRWPEIVKEAARLMAGDGVFVAREMRRRALPKAMAVKVAGLDSDSEKIRQDVATEIIEGELGKPRQTIENSGNQTITVKVLKNVSLDDL